ncbi:DUF397 domain-containing protein [Streptomyces sp. NPDC004675]|uniref:DUF397 domain-containing protein n=1 Tax=Streptomyces sp. NPDC004675 TaxID=3154286 RepID=UPI0033ABE353
MSSALQWFKSTYSGSEGGECLEVAFASDDFGTARTVHVRDSKNPTGPVFTASPEAWAAFTDYATR